MKQWEIQQALYDELIATPIITDAVTGVYDNVPQDAVYPYIVIGDDTGVQWDTDDGKGVNSTLTIHIWSRYSGKKECKEIMNGIYGVLHRANITIINLHVVSCDWEFSETYMEADGETRHGVMRFRIIAHEEVS